MIDAKAILKKLETFAHATGYFESVNGHEPKSAPTLFDQMNLSFWSGPIVPISSSGLKSISYRWQIEARIFVSADSEPADDIDPAIITATFAFFGKLAEDFDLGQGGRVRCIDFYGSDGEPLSATPGYYEYDGNVVRTMDIVIPLLLNDVTDIGAQ